MVSGTFMISPGTNVSLGTFNHYVEFFYLDKVQQVSESYSLFLRTSTSQMYLAIPRIVSLLALVSLAV